MAEFLISAKGLLMYCSPLHFSNRSFVTFSQMFVSCLFVLVQFVQVVSCKAYVILFLYVCVCTGPCQARGLSGGLLTPCPLVTVTVRETAVPAEPADTGDVPVIAVFALWFEHVCVYAQSCLVSLWSYVKKVLGHMGLFERTEHKLFLSSPWGLMFSSGLWLFMYLLPVALSNSNDKCDSKSLKVTISTTFFLQKSLQIWLKVFFKSSSPGRKGPMHVPSITCVFFIKSLFNTSLFTWSKHYSDFIWKDRKNKMHNHIGWERREQEGHPKRKMSACSPLVFLSLFFFVMHPLTFDIVLKRTPFDFINWFNWVSFVLTVRIFIELKCLVARRWRGSQGPGEWERNRYESRGKRSTSCESWMTNTHAYGVSQLWRAHAVGSFMFLRAHSSRPCPSIARLVTYDLFCVTCLCRHESCEMVSVENV